MCDVGLQCLHLTVQIPESQFEVLLVGLSEVGSNDEGSEVSIRAALIKSPSVPYLRCARICASFFVCLCLIEARELLFRGDFVSGG